MIFTAAQFYAHIIGDYVFQNAWMAARKTKSSLACLAHVLTYVLPFLFITRSPLALAVIVGTHFAIDRWRLARYVCWARNWLAPRWLSVKLVAGMAYTPEQGDHSLFIVENRRNKPWKDCRDTGSDDTVPSFLSVWLMIILDNAIHIGINALAIYYL